MPLVISLFCIVLLLLPVEAAVDINTTPTVEVVDIPLITQFFTVLLDASLMNITVAPLVLVLEMVISLVVPPTVFEPSIVT